MLIILQQELNARSAALKSLRSQEHRLNGDAKMFVRDLMNHTKLTFRKCWGTNTYPAPIQRGNAARHHRNGGGYCSTWPRHQRAGISGKIVVIIWLYLSIFSFVSTTRRQHSWRSNWTLASQRQMISLLKQNRLRRISMKKELENCLALFSSNIVSSPLSLNPWRSRNASRLIYPSSLWKSSKLMTR